MLYKKSYIKMIIKSIIKNRVIKKLLKWTQRIPTTRVNQIHYSPPLYLYFFYAAKDLANCTVYSTEQYKSGSCTIIQCTLQYSTVHLFVFLTLIARAYFPADQ